MFEYRPMRSVIYVDCVREEYRHRLQHWLYAIHVPDSIKCSLPWLLIALIMLMCIFCA